MGPLRWEHYQEAGELFILWARRSRSSNRVGGFCAETAGATALFAATLTGIPVSTTHTITGAIVGVGATRRFSAVKWGVARRIVWAWVLTIPMAGGFAALYFFVIRLIHHLTAR